MVQSLPIGKLFLISQSLFRIEYVDSEEGRDNLKKVDSEKHL